MSALEQTYITPEQYFELERHTRDKSEYFSGRMFAMSGGSNAHSLIGGTVHALLWSQMRGKPCFTFSSDMKVRVNTTGLYTYPDVSVVCGDLREGGSQHRKKRADAPHRGQQPLTFSRGMRYNMAHSVSAHAHRLFPSG